MPKAKPVSLHPLSFDDAIKALIRADPACAGRDSGSGMPKRKPTTKKKQGK